MEDLIAVALVVGAQDVGLGGSVAAVALVGERRVAGKLHVLALLLVLAMDDAHKALLFRRPSVGDLQDQYTNLSGSNAPRSVTMRVMRPAGVTSKAGFHTSTPSIATGRTSEASRSSMGMPEPSAIAGSMVEVGAAT